MSDEALARIAAALELSALGLVLAVLLAWRGLPALVTLGRSPSVASADTAN